MMIMARAPCWVCLVRRAVFGQVALASMATNRSLLLLSCLLARSLVCLLCVCSLALLAAAFAITTGLDSSEKVQLHRATSIEQLQTWAGCSVAVLALLCLHVEAAIGCGSRSTITAMKERGTRRRACADGKHAFPAAAMPHVGVVTDEVHCIVALWAVSLPILYRGEFLCRYLYTMSPSQFL